MSGELFCMDAVAVAGVLLLLGLGWTLEAGAARVQSRYYAYPAVEDADGVIAPWYRGQNGQWDFRVRIAAETMKRYPWTTRERGPVPAPEYMVNGSWTITPEGEISVPDSASWDNGDLGQRAAYVLAGWVDYYRYSGDPAALAHMAMQADLLLDYCQTPDTHPWPSFLISVPLRGQAYGAADEHGLIQLDIVAEVGLALLRAYQLAGEERWFAAARHWGDVLAARRSRTPNAPPWGRYANPEDASWEDLMTGGIAFLLTFFDELIQLGYAGEGGAILDAREAGRAWLKDHLLPRWTVDDTWGRNYWDWPDPVQAENVTEFVVQYLLGHPDVFPNWRADARNVLSLFLTRTSVCPNSGGDVYSGAWAYPESSSCCGRSLWYGPLELAPVWAQLGAAAQNDWALEMARRQAILSTYDCHETGVVEDGIDGGPVVAGAWFKIAHPMALKHVLNTMAWMPDICGAGRENHIMRTASVVNHVTYEKGRVAYTVFDGREGAIDVLRLAFTPTELQADGEALPKLDTLDRNGYSVEPLSNGDCIVRVRHDGLRAVVVIGEDPQSCLDDSALGFSAEWTRQDDAWSTEASGASIECAFDGNQVRVTGRAAVDGGLADVFLDGVKQRVPVDCWIPFAPRSKHVLFHANGLAAGRHHLKIVARGEGNARSRGARVYIEGVQYSQATGAAFTGPRTDLTQVQRMVFGRTEREDYIDSKGNAWRPATEVVSRLGLGADIVRQCWWTDRRRFAIAGTPDPELYRYGFCARDFWINLTVGRGPHYVRLKFAETRAGEPAPRTVSISINGEEKVCDMDIQATAGGQAKAVDLVFNDVMPSHGIIEVRLWNNHDGEAVLQALEVGLGDGGTGAVPITWTPPA